MRGLAGVLICESLQVFTAFT